MQIAINTASLSSDTVAALAQAKGLGFGAVEVNLHQTELQYDYRRQPNLDFYDVLTQEINLRGLEVVAVHHLFLTGWQAFSTQARRELLGLAGRLTARLGASLLIVRPSDLFTGEQSLVNYFKGDRETFPLIPGFGQVQDELDDLGVTLGLENMNHWDEALIENQAEQMMALAETLDCRLVLDVPLALERPNLARWVELAGKRIALVRVYDLENVVERHPPLSTAWQERIAQLEHSAVRACVLDAGDAQMAHGNIRASLDLMKRLWGVE